MNRKLPLALVISALVVGALAGCSPRPLAPVPESRVTTGPTTSTSSAAAAAVSTSLGTAIVNGDGRTAYFFDHDTANSGKSACTGVCSATWHAITSSSNTPAVTGITVTIGTIPDGAGRFQVTVDGLPIYTYSGDSASGDLNGEGVGGIWWVAGADGKEIKSSAAGNGYHK